MSIQIYDINKVANLVLVSGVTTKYLPLEPQDEKDLVESSLSVLKQMHYIASHVANGLVVHKNPQFAHVKSSDWLKFGAELELEAKYNKRG